MEEGDGNFNRESFVTLLKTFLDEKQIEELDKINPISVDYNEECFEEVPSFVPETQPNLDGIEDESGYPSFEGENYEIVLFEGGTSQTPMIEPPRPLVDISDRVYNDFTTHFSTNQIFASIDELSTWCKNIGLEHNIVVVKVKSEKPISGVRSGRIELGCDRGGKYKRSKKCLPIGHNDSRDCTATKKNQCPFMLKGVPQGNGTWKVVVKCGRHNHDIDTTLFGHSFVSRLSKEEFEHVRRQTNGHVKAKRIFGTLKETFPNNLSKMKAIYNARHKLRVEARQGLTLIQYLLKMLKENDYVFNYLEDCHHSITNLFMCHKKSIQFAKCFPHVFVLDCTYKTNKYKMPLFEIVGIASTGKSFNLAFVFMDRELQSNYEWALEMTKTVMGDDFCPRLFVTDSEKALMNAVEKVFPNAVRITCKWHVGKNIESHCKKLFDTLEVFEEFKSDWDSITNQLTEDLFDAKWKSFEEKWSPYSNDLRIALIYIENTWLPVKESFGVPWTKKHYHFGATTTQRVEGAHSVLKQILGSCSGSLSLVWDTIHVMITTQIHAIMSDIEDSIYRPTHAHSSNFLTTDLSRHVSKYALNKIFEEKERGEKHVGANASHCGCLLQTTCGLPCAHELMVLKMCGASISLSSIHSQWRQLSIIPSSYSDEVLSRDDEMVALTQLWTQGEDADKRMLKRKLREILVPSSTIVEEPKVTTIRKGRPALSKKKRQDNSTRRDKSSFEMARTRDEVEPSGRGRPSMGVDKRCKASTSESKKSFSSKPTKEVRTTDQVRTTDPILRWIPKYIHPLILELRDVEGDGNCGFHGIALALGYNYPDAWRQVRCEVLNELEVNKKWYLAIWGVEEFENAKRRLDCKTKVAPPQHWMDLFDGVIVANTYKIIFCIVSPDVGITYFPTYEEPRKDWELNIFALALINKIHYVHLKLKPDVPLPPPHSVSLKHALVRPPSQLHGRFEAWSTIAPSKQKVDNDDVIDVDG